MRPLLLAARQPMRGPGVLAGDLAGIVIVEGAVADQDEVVILARAEGSVGQECLLTTSKVGVHKLPKVAQILQAHLTRASGAEVFVWVR